MTPVIPWSMSNISLFPGATLTINKYSQFTRCSVSRKHVKRTSCSQKLVLPVPTLTTSFPRSGLLHRSIQLKVSATGTDVKVEEPDSPVLDEGSSGASEAQTDAGETTETSPAKSDAIPASGQSRRARPVRKSEMPPVKNEDLIPGAMFSGKIRSIQPFGAFVDFGAFTDGLVHVSRLCDSFVKDVGDVVSIGQEVQVRLIEANAETGRISLSMRESDDPAKVQQQKDTPATASSDKPRSPRRNTGRSNQKRDEGKNSKFVKGQELEGTVKNLTRSGAFISLPEGEEGFLPTSEESDDGLGSMLGTSSLEVGQEVSVRVLRLSRGQVTLTMKKEEDEGKLDMEFSQGVVHSATNPFVLAFRQNKDIAAFLDDREKVEEPKEKASEEVGSQENQTKIVSDVPDVHEQPEKTDEVSVGASTEAVVSDESVDSETTKSEEKEDDSSAVLDLEGSASTVGESIAETPSTDLAEKSDKSDSSAEIAIEASSVENLVSEEIVENQPTEADEISSAASHKKDDAGATSDETGTVIGSDVQEDLASPLEAKDEGENVESIVAPVDSSEATVLSSESQAVEEIAEKQVETAQDDAEIQTSAAETETTVSEKEVVEDVVTDQVEAIKEEVQVQTPAAETETISSDKESVEEVVTDQVEDIKEDVQVQTPAAETETTSSENQAVEEVVTDQVQDIKDEVQVQTPAETETTSSENQAVEEVVENQVEDTKEVQIETPAAVNGTPEKVESASKNATKAAISPALVKQLRDETGAGMMDCKKALSETGGDIVKAQEYLRMKGLASAEKKASRATAEGRIGSYIHDSRIGVLVEVNCETDFVSRGEIFKELVDDIAMQVAACPQVQYLVTEDVPEEIVNKEREIEMQKEDLASKPEQIREKIVEGRIRKRLEELALLEQPYIKNDKVVIKDWVKQTIATIGENIKVKRFIRYNLGEGLERKSQDFAAEVAAQTAAKPAAAPAPANEQPAAPEPKETEEKKPAVAVSAALVKQLREETGAGMMDCKKALSETGGDLEKAQEYLRKKGLSTADKKSSRLAAEGRIGAYIHDSRIGVLIEVNCETDFVGRSENFKELVNDLAMQVVACPQVQFVSIEDIAEEIVQKEKELEMQREDLASKPENIRELIVEGRVSKRLGELTLLEQPFIKDDSILVKDLVKQTVAALGENIKVRRFVRFTLGETTEGSKSETESKGMRDEF